MQALHLETPIRRNAEIDARLNKQIYFKMECYQPTGSFKIRGIGAVCQHALSQGKTRLISSSGGNAGYAAAYAGNQSGVPVTVVVPETTSETAKQRIKAQNAELIIHGEVWNEADALARQLVEESDAAYIHPFDNPICWQGHATMVDELASQIEKPDAVVVAVGGGGLLAGTLEGMHKNNWQDVPVLAVETEGAASFSASYHAKKLTKLDKITSIASTLGALQVTGTLINWLDKHPITPLLVSDKSAVDACLSFTDDLRVLVEPACGAALSLIYDNSDYLADYDSVLMIVCGGAGVNIQQLLNWQKSLS